MHSDPGVVVELAELFPVPGQGVVTQQGLLSRAPKNEAAGKAEGAVSPSFSQPWKGFRHRDWSILGTKGSPKFQLLSQELNIPLPEFSGSFKIKFAKCAQSQVLLLGHYRVGFSEPQAFLGIREES